MHPPYRPMQLACERPPAPKKAMPRLGGPLPDALEPACPDCEEDGLPLEPVAAPDDIFSIAATAPID